MYEVKKNRMQYSVTLFIRKARIKIIHISITLQIYKIKSEWQ